MAGLGPPSLRGAGLAGCIPLEVALRWRRQSHRSEQHIQALEENRRVINNHLTLSGQTKASFTHIVAWAIVKAAKQFPRMKLASIGPETTKALSLLGLAPNMEAREHTIDGVVKSLLHAQKVAAT